jgi:hypothetical protein
MKETIAPYTARRRKGRIAGQLKRRLDKMMRRLPECQWVLAYRFLGETKSCASHEWHAIASHDALVTKTMAATPSYDDALLRPDSTGTCPEKPRNAVTRASLCRAMLKDHWLEHVKGTPFEGKVQMYRMVQDGSCPPLPWWDRVAGVEFTNDALNHPDVSSRVWDFLIDTTVQSKMK